MAARRPGRPCTANLPSHRSRNRHLPRGVSLRGDFVQPPHPKSPHSTPDSLCGEFEQPRHPKSPHSAPESFARRIWATTAPKIATLRAGLSCAANLSVWKLLAVGAGHGRIGRPGVGQNVRSRTGGGASRERLDRVVRCDAGKCSGSPATPGWAYPHRPGCGAQNFIDPRGAHTVRCEDIRRCP